MKTKKFILIRIIVLIILLSLNFIFNLEDKNPINTSVNNNSNISINKTIDKNIISNNNSTINRDGNKNYNMYNKPKYISVNKKYSNKSHYEALKAKKVIEESVLNQNEFAGFPVYKDKRMGLWLVPIFDKNTREYKGSVFVSDGSIFISGPDTYSAYKELVSGKKIKHNSKSSSDKTKVNKSNKKTIKNKTNTNKSTKNNIKSSLINSSTLKSKLTQQKFYINESQMNHSNSYNLSR